MYNEFTLERITGLNMTRFTSLLATLWEHMKAGQRCWSTASLGLCNNATVQQGTGNCHVVGIKQLKVKNMKIYLSYLHDANAPLIEKIKEYLSKDAEGNFKHEV